MRYRFYDIDPLLKPFVYAICATESDLPADWVTPVRVLPDTRVELFINFCPPQRVATANGAVGAYGRSFVTARMNQFMDVRTPEKVSFVSVCFHSGSAYPFFPVPMHAMANQNIDLRLLWGRRAEDLQERVEEAETMPQRVAIVQQYLLACLPKAESLDTAVDFGVRQIRQTHGRLSLAALASQTGISNRQLARRFNQRIGLSPKEFARITCFLNALDQLKAYPARNLTDIAYESGYYDQAHFIHTCRDYSGLPPGQLVISANVLSC